MPAPARAHLLLPGPLGLLHYDLVEEAAFLGVGANGGVTAAATPFRAATAALTHDGAGYVVRSLPGEPPPEVNGEPSEGARLNDGDRIRIGDQVVLARMPQATPQAAVRAGAVAAVAAVPVAATPRGPAAMRRTTTPKAARQVRAILLGAGALVLLFAAYRAIRLLQTTGPGPVPPLPVEDLVAKGQAQMSVLETRALKDFEAAEAYAREHGDDGAGAASRFEEVIRRHPDTVAARRATGRIRETWPRVSASAWEQAKVEVDAAVGGARYRDAVLALRRFLARYDGTREAPLATRREQEVREAARGALEALRRRVAPLLATDSTRAYKILYSAGLDLPPDLAEELAALMARVRASWEKSSSVPTPPTRGPGAPFTGPKPTAGDGPGVPGAPRADDDESKARAVWLQARADLAARRFEDARRGYSQLLKDYGRTGLVGAHPERVRAGRTAADFGLRGPAAFLRGPATFERGRLTVEYVFDETRSFQEDFAIEQAFAGTDPLEAEVRAGMAILSGSTAMLLKIVFDPTDVAWEADCVADQHQDYGLIAQQEGREYRLLALHVANTQFKLKKGPAAKTLDGDVLWLFGDGVWRDADPGERGFVRLAQKPACSLRPGERAHLDVDLRGTGVEAILRGKQDTSQLKGTVKGDDGRGLGPLRVGAFAYKGRVGVDRLKVNGKVDEAWATKRYQEIAAEEVGPD